MLQRTNHLTELTMPYSPRHPKPSTFFAEPLLTIAVTVLFTYALVSDPRPAAPTQPDSPVLAQAGTRHAG
ncbi:hypothetical protein [Chitinimonas sp. JJ19]|uniref:hypothetical protein n=1 Tax=Chitinimonas sp. JJ19 TaxID=3109352 RepID=UPI003002A1A5